MAGEPRRTLGERMSERMKARHAPHRATAHVSSFFSRFGLADPLDHFGSSARGAANGEAFFDLLRRLGQAESRREQRFSRLFGRDASAPFQRFGGEKPRLLAPSSLSSFGMGDFLLIRPSTQAPAPEVDMAEQAVRRVPTRKPRLIGREPKVKTSRAVRQALTPPPAKKGARLPVMEIRPPVAGRVRETAAPTAPRPERRQRARDVETVSVLPVLRSLERVASSVAEPEKAAIVRRLAGELRQTSPKTWTAQIRATLRQIGAKDDVLVAEVEASLPDTYVSPVTMAMSRLGDRPERGLKPVTRRSPLVSAASATERRPATRHVRKVRAGAPKRTIRARMQPQRVVGVARRATATRAAASAGASKGASDGLEGPARRSIRQILADAGDALILDQGVEQELGLEDVRSIAKISERRERAAASREPATARAEAGSFSGQRWADDASPAAQRRARSQRRVISAARIGSSAASASTTSSVAPSARLSRAPLIQRVGGRDERSGAVGLRSAFYARLGLPAAVGVAGAEALAPTVEGAEVPRLERLAASRARRDAREQAFDAAHAGPRAEAVKRLWPGERAQRAASMPTLAPSDLLLPRPQDAATTTAEQEVQPTRAVSRSRALASVLGRGRPAKPGVAPVQSARSQPPRARREDRPAVSARRPASPTRQRVGAVERDEVESVQSLSRPIQALAAELSRAPLYPVSASAFAPDLGPELGEEDVRLAPPRPTRAMQRAGERLVAQSAEQPAARALQDAALSAPSARAVARVVQAIEAISSEPHDSKLRSAVVRQALRELGPVGRIIAAEVEAALPADQARPETVARARIGAAEGRNGLGLRPILQRSPSLVELIPQAPVPAAAPAETATKAASRAPAARSASARAVAPRSARLSASPVARAPAALARTLSASPVNRSKSQSAAARSAGASAPVASSSRGGLVTERAPRASSSTEAMSEVDRSFAAAPEIARSARPSALAMARAVQTPDAASETGRSAPSATARAEAKLGGRSTAPVLRGGRFQAKGVAGAELSAAASPASELGSASHAVARLEVEPSGRSVLPRVTPSADAALRRTLSRALGGFAPEQSLVRPTIPGAAAPDAGSAEGVVTRTPTRRPLAERERAARSLETSTRPEASRREASERSFSAASPRAGAFVPVRVLDALYGAPDREPAASRDEQRPGAVLRASTRGEASFEAASSLLPNVTPRLDRALAPARSGRRTLSLSGEIVLPMPQSAEATTPAREATAPTFGVRPAVRASERAELSEVRGSLMPAITPRHAASRQLRGLRAGLSRAAAPLAFEGPALALPGRSVAAAAQRALPAAEGVAAARGAQISAMARSEGRPARGEMAVRAAFSASRRLADRPRGPLSYVSAPDAVFARANLGDGAAAAEVAGGARALDRTRARSATLASRAPGAALGRLQQPASAGAGVVRLLSEARAVQEVLAALSRGPSARDARVQRVSAGARQLLGEVMAEASQSGTASAQAGARAALTEVHALLSGLTPTEATPARALRVIPGRTRRSTVLSPDQRLPTQASVAATAAATAEPARPGRSRTRLTQIRALVGGAQTDVAGAPAPADRGARARRSRLEPRQRLSARTPTAESILFARPEGVEPAAAGGRRGPLTETLGAVGTGELGPTLPGWAHRSVGETRVRGTVGGLMDALARAKSPTEVVRAMDRRDASVRSNRTLPAPVLRLIEEIRSEAAAEAEASAQEMAAALGLPTPAASRRRGGTRSSSQSQVFRGFTNLSQTKRTEGQDGLGADRLMKLVRKLQQLVFLADSQKDAAMRQVRLAEDSASARSEGQAAPTQSGDSKSQQVDVDALAQEVMQHVQRELESRSERRQDDPDNRTPWW